MTEHDFDRRDVLRALTALGVTGVTASLFGGTAEASGTSPLDLEFSVVERFRPFDLIAPKFVQLDTRARAGALVETGLRPRAPFAAVTVEVTEGGGRVVAGLAGGGVSVLGTYDAGTGQARIELTTAAGTAVVKTVTAELRGSFGFAVVVNENAVTVLADTGAGWRPLLTERDQVRARVDLRDPAVLGKLGYAYGSGAGTRLGRVRAGYFGQAGVRDPHVVQYADGRPYIRHGKLYLTMTNAGLGFFQQAHWGVWTLDLADPTQLEQVAALFFERDGVVLGDHAGQIVRDDDHDRFILLIELVGRLRLQRCPRPPHRHPGRRPFRRARAADPATAAAHHCQFLGPGADPDRRPLARRVRRKPGAATVVRVPPRAGRHGARGRLRPRPDPARRRSFGQPDRRNDPATRRRALVPVRQRR
ncbi:hypothetical protein [Amycolatopsis nalaikhensis]|uniref:Phytase-like domain-containing protein n=1 Tax=Amycolatopsis nalaikhensis TaxID=715472 RepID=A0ABY8XFN3_9PSEU|nr:hypothetical protein [Amycolatopsis sp. 2-2]WIV54434.1 hypothetical protein QP939_37090 [Amycolatopsis sp. 2-2]